MQEIEHEAVEKYAQYEKDINDLFYRACAEVIDLVGGDRVGEFMAKLEEHFDSEGMSAMLLSELDSHSAGAAQMIMDRWSELCDGLVDDARSQGPDKRVTHKKMIKELSHLPRGAHIRQLAQQVLQGLGTFKL